MDHCEGVSAAFRHTEISRTTIVLRQRVDRGTGSSDVSQSDSANLAASQGFDIKRLDLLFNLHSHFTPKASIIGRAMNASLKILLEFLEHDL